jgi:hypothetical protein
MGTGRQHEARFDGNLEIDWVLKTGEDSVWEQNQDTKLKEGGCFAIIPDWVACGSRNEEWWSCGVFLTTTDHRQGMIGSKRYEGLEGLLWWRLLFGIDGGLGSFISQVFKLIFWCRVQMRIGNLDSLEIKSSIFILLIRFNHFTCNACAIRPHKIKRVVHYYKLCVVGGKNALANIFYWFNVSQCTYRRWITTVSNLHACPLGQYQSTHSCLY